MFMHKCFLLCMQSSKTLKLTTLLINDASSPSFNGTSGDSKKPTTKLAISLFLSITLQCVLPR